MKKSAVLLLLCLTLSAVPAHAFPSALVVSSPPWWGAAVERLTSWLPRATRTATTVTKGGSCTDPNGCPAPKPTSSTQDDGTCGIDPNGKPYKPIP